MKTKKSIQFSLSHQLPLLCNKILREAFIAAQISSTDLTQHALSERVGISQSSVNRHLNGESKMNIGEAMEYARVFNINPIQFFGPLMQEYASHFKWKKLKRAIEETMSQRLYHAAAVCYQVSEGQVRFLMVRSQDKGFWVFPRGANNKESSAALSTLAMQRLLKEGGVYGEPQDESFATMTRSSEVVEQLFLVELVHDVMHRAEPGRKPRMFTLHEAEAAIESDRKDRGRKKKTVKKQINILRYAHEIIAKQRGLDTGRKKAK